MPKNPVVPRPNFAYFDRECGESHVYVGTQGRGVWRIKYASRDPAQTKTCLADCQVKVNACLKTPGVTKAECAARSKICAATCQCPA